MTGYPRLHSPGRAGPARTLTVLSAALLAASPLALARSSFISVPVSRETQLGPPVAGADQDRILLANEPQEATGAALEFDLSKVCASSTALARITIDGVARAEVARAGMPVSRERAALHVFLVDDAGRETLAGSTYVKPGGQVNRYVIAVTDAVNAVLAQPPARRRVRFAVRITGKPIPREVYALPLQPPTLDLAPPGGWLDDWEQRIQPIVSGPLVYRESCLPLTSDRGADVALSLLYPARRITEVIDLGAGKPLDAGRDWILRDGRLVLPAGSRAPIQLEAEFFLSPHRNPDGTTKMVRGAIKLVSGTWYHERQLEVTYEPETRDWTWPAAISTLDRLPRTRRLLREKQPLTMILFGDSISEGYSSSGIDGAWPYQPGYGDLVARRLREVYHAPITFMNHARAGDTAAHAVTVADAQVAWFKPDLVLLAYGMNDRPPGRREVERANLEKIIAIVRARSPQTEFLVITPMLNNPQQPTGLGPVEFIRDEERKIDARGVAFVDMTSTELAMLDRKPYLDLSGNGANHPNDFLHRIYAQRILEVLAPSG